MASKAEYKELSNAQIEPKRRLVISQCVKDGQDCGFTLAQQIEVDEGKKTTRVFLKGGVHVSDVDGMYNLRDAINDAIKKYEDNKEAGWDE